MSFQHPDLLWLLVAFPVLAILPIFAWRRRRSATKRFGAAGAPAGLSLVAGRSGPFRAARAVIFLFALLLGLVALAGPQYGSRARILRRRGVDIVVALDFSKSMLARDVSPSRIERAKAELIALLAEFEGDRVGVIAFAGETMEYPMTMDYAAISLFLNDLGPYDMPVGGTAIGRALVSAKRLLDRAASQVAQSDEASARSQVVILLTDGEDHQGQPAVAAQTLADAGVVLHTVGIGSATGEPIPTYAPDGTWTGYLRDAENNVITSALTAENEAELQQLAELTGGHYFHAGQGQVGIDQIRAELRAMHQHENRARRITVHEARYSLLLLPAFLLLLLEGLLPEAWIERWRPRKRPPQTRKRRIRRTS